MSGSSRSIAAARQKRAGEAPPVGRPQQQQQPTFSQKPQQQPQSQPQRNVKIQSQPQFQQHQQKQPSPVVGISQFNGKLSISDAIGLITLRLGRIEQYIQDSNTENGEGHKLPANSQIVDNSVLMSIISRLDSLEKRENYSDKIIKIEHEIKLVKDLLIMHINKFETSNVEIETRFQDIESGFVELEKNIHENNQIDVEDEQTIVQQVQDELNTENITLEIENTEESVLSSSILSVDLKNIMIES